MKAIYLLLAWLALALGVIGVVLPVLPTTPFLLLALFCFGKGSPRWRAWFVRTRLYQKYLKTFDETRAMTLKQKITILALAAPFCLMAFWRLPHWGARLGLVALIAWQYWYFFTQIKTLPPRYKKTESTPN